MQTFIINIVVFEIKVLTKYIDRTRISHAQKLEIKKQFNKVFNKFHLIMLFLMNIEFSSECNIKISLLSKIKITSFEMLI